MQINRTRLILIGLVVVAIGVLALTWFLGVSPQLASWSDSDQQYEQTKSRNDAAQIKANRLRQQYAKLDDLKAELAQYQQGVPVTDQSPALIRQVNQAASSSGVTIKQFVVGDAQIYAPPQWFSAPDTGGRLVTSPITIQASGSTDQLRAFVGNIQGMKRYLTISDVSYAVDDSGDGTTANINGTAWVLQSAEAAAAANPSPSSSASASGSASASASSTSAAK